MKKIPIPDDVREWVRKVFETCNRRTTEKIARMPTVHEESLDLTLIEQFSHFASPVKLPSSWLVRIETHYLGGYRHFHSWEIADVGLLVIFRRGGKLIRTKVALLQSKRLYPQEQDLSGEQASDYIRGFGRLLESDQEHLMLTKPRKFSFSQSSRYRALRVNDDQYKAISRYEAEYGIPVYYLLYNPPKIPLSRTLPLARRIRIPRVTTIGCRIVPSRILRASLKRMSDSYSPTYQDLKRHLGAPFDSGHSAAGWRLENFAADLLMDCEEGYRTDTRQDRALVALFTERAAPIAAAVAVTFDAPD